MKHYIISVQVGNRTGNVFHRGSLVEFYKNCHAQKHNPIIIFYREITAEEFNELTSYFAEFNKNQQEEAHGLDQQLKAEEIEEINVAND